MQLDVYWPCISIHQGVYRKYRGFIQYFSAALVEATLSTAQKFNATDRASAGSEMVNVAPCGFAACLQSYRTFNGPDDNFSIIQEQLPIWVL